MMDFNVNNSNNNSSSSSSSGGKRSRSSGGTGGKAARRIQAGGAEIARRRRLEIRRFRVIANSEPAMKKARSESSSPDPNIMEQPPAVHSNGCHRPALHDAGGSGSSGSGSGSGITELLGEQVGEQVGEGLVTGRNTSGSSGSSGGTARSARCVATDCCPPHGAVYICGRRREMEDAVAVVPSFMSVPCGTVGGCGCTAPCGTSALHFFGVYDGHGGAQVAAYCKEHLHAAVVEELSAVQPSVPPGELEAQLKRSMVASFLKVDAQVGGFRHAIPTSTTTTSSGSGSSSEGEESPSSSISFVAPETSGSTAVVAVLGSDRIIVANCGDSRAVLSRGGRAIPLSRDHKPDHDDELARVEAAGGRVIFWNGYRVLGVLAMSRAIGDRYLKPFIIPEPDVTCTERSDEDECLILASDGLWDVLSNEVACEIARKCLFGKHRNQQAATADDKEESNADIAAGLLTKFAIAKGSCDNISVVVVDLKSRRRR